MLQKQLPIFSIPGFFYDRGGSMLQSEFTCKKHQLDMFIFLREYQENNTSVLKSLCENYDTIICCYQLPVLPYFNRRNWSLPHGYDIGVVRCSTINDQDANMHL